jgi:hypothetical protein
MEQMQMKQVKCRILTVSTAALLAGTMMAAGQGIPDRKEGGARAQQPGVSQSQPKDAQQGQQREERGGQAQREPSQREHSKPSTTGQAPRGEEQNRAQDNQRGQEQEKRAPAQAQQRDQDQKRTEGQTQRNQDQKSTQGQIQNRRDQEQNRTEGRAEQGSKASGGTSSVTLSTAQRTKLRQTVIEGRNAPKVGKVDFSLTEGTVIPRSVRVVAVPETIVEIHPEWRGYRYFVYNDEIIIVEPDTLRIVAIVEV